MSNDKMPTLDESNLLITESKPTKRSVHFEDLWEVIGGFGRYPILLYIFMCYVTVIVDFQQFVPTYYGSAPNYECISWGGGNASVCKIQKKCDCTNCTFVFDDEFTSVVSEWGLICSKAHLKALSQAIFYGGVLVGSVVNGKLSDHFGRKPALFLSVFFMLIFGLGSGFANSLTLFSVLRFGAGFGTAGALLIRFVYQMEVSTLKLRTMLGIVSNFAIIGGAVLLTGIAYLIRDWSYLMIAISIPCAPVLFFWRLIPESPSWLIAKGRLKEAQQVLERFAAANGHKVDPKLLESMIKDVKSYQEQLTTDSSATKSSILDLIKTKKMRKRTLILCFNWFVNSVVFYGIALNAKNLGGSLHLNVFILFISGLPGVLALWILIGKAGRRLGYASLMLFCGLMSLLVLAVPESQGDHVAIKVLAVCGVFSIIGTFSGIYIYTSELNPTLLRNLSLGVGSMTSRVGGIIAPYIVYLNDFMTNLPFIVFGVMAFTAGILAMFLPETLFSPMPQTVDQVETWDEDYGLPCKKRTHEPEEVMVQDDEEEDDEQKEDCKTEHTSVL